MLKIFTSLQYLVLIYPTLKSKYCELSIWTFEYKQANLQTKKSSILINIEIFICTIESCYKALCYFFSFCNFLKPSISQKSLGLIWFLVWCYNICKPMVHLSSTVRMTVIKTFSSFGNHGYGFVVKTYDYFHIKLRNAHNLGD